jgi:hypothetical protein
MSFSEKGGGLDFDHGTGLSKRAQMHNTVSSHLRTTYTPDPDLNTMNVGWRRHVLL